MDFKELSFETPDAENSALLSSVEYLLPDVEVSSILELGCGQGTLLQAMSERYPEATIAGIDISEDNVVAAVKLFKSMGQNSQIFHVDIIDAPQHFSSGVDLVFGNSVFQLIQHPDDQTVEATSLLVKQGGYLLLCLPSRTVYNSVLYTVRRFFKIIRSDQLDSILLKLAVRAFPSWNEKAIEDRIPYMYDLPWRIYGSKLKKLFDSHGISEIAQTKMPFILGKPKHITVLFKKQESQA